MARLREKLQRLRTASAMLREGIPTPQERYGRIEDLVPGFEIENDRGRSYVGRVEYPLGSRHGEVRLSDLLSINREPMAILGRDAGLADVPLDRIVFIDTETTGLAGGAGTYAFMVGMGHMVEGAFRIDQYFMRDLPEEPAMLTHLNDHLAGFEAIVSFNGKGFDWPLIRDRYVSNRMRLRLGDPAHFDLLFPCRRLWRDRLGACDLGSLEQGVLGYRRREDIPSALVPQVYFDYIRRKDPRRMRLVFAHNAQDIVSLWALTIRVCRLWAEPQLEETEPVDLYSLGRGYAAEGRLEDAVRAFEGAIARGLPQDFEWRAQVRLSLAYKRAGDRAKAAEIWEDMCRGAFWTGFPYIELAKYREHQLREIEQAIDAAEAGLAVVRDTRSDSPDAARRRERDDLEYRLGRLRRKLAARAGPAQDGGPIEG
jgi:uncharacterized protein YprB with RNaseH-like and TPR domain